MASGQAEGGYPGPGRGASDGQDGDAAATQAAARPDPLRQEILRLRAANQAAAKENSRLRAEAADKQFDLEQLGKQIRKLERKIDALEDVNSKKAVTKGFLKPMPADYQCPPVEQKPPEKPKSKPWETVTKGGKGVIIDSMTGEEVNPKDFWPEDEESANILLRKGDHSVEAELMREMQNPIEVNPDFDTKRYAELVGAKKQKDAEEMIQQEGGPTLEQMQRRPLEVLRSSPNLDPNWCDPQYNGCSLLQWACSMGFDDVVLGLLQRGADPNHKTGQRGISCLSSTCAMNWTTCARHLLEHRADPNEIVEPQGGQSVIMWASRVEYCDKEGKEHVNPFVSLLLEHKANVEARDDKGKTPLIHASTSGNVPVVQALLASRADVDVQDNDGDTAWQVALRYYHGKISSLLLQHRKAATPANASAQSVENTESAP